MRTTHWCGGQRRWRLVNSSRNRSFLVAELRATRPRANQQNIREEKVRTAGQKWVGVRVTRRAKTAEQKPEFPLEESIRAERRLCASSEIAVPSTRNPRQTHVRTLTHGMKPLAAFVSFCCSYPLHMQDGPLKEPSACINHLRPTHLTPLTKKKEG